MDDRSGVLFDRFIIPPFSVLDTFQGPWKVRRKLWDDLGIRSESGRGEFLTYGDEGRDDFLQTEFDKSGSTSTFDPVLCEMMYRWFTPNTGSILDPFAGGSTRGVVAGRLGRSYTGVDLREEQVVENLPQWRVVCPDANVQWICGDSTNIPTLLPEGSLYDFVFSCPPYGDLEVYSDDPKDLSNMAHKDFVASYRTIIRHSLGYLKPNRFAAFVVGNYRLKGGEMFDFTGETVRAFEEAGAKFYNQFVLVNPVGTLRLRVTRQFEASRKAGMRHQMVLVFVKGDAKKATSEIGPVDPRYPGGVFDKAAGTSVLDLFT
jgi:hypothetical protein